MAALPKTVRDFTAFIDGVGMAGKVQTGVLPDLDIVTEDYTAGGIGGTLPIDMAALEKLEASLEMAGLSADFLRMLGKSDGQLTLRGAISDGGVTEAAIFQMRGLFKKAEFGDLKVKDKNMTKITAVLSYFKVTISGEAIVEVDIVGKRFIVDGTDRWADIRTALGE